MTMPEKFLFCLSLVKSDFLVEIRELFPAPADNWRKKGSSYSQQQDIHLMRFTFPL